MVKVLCVQNTNVALPRECEGHTEHPRISADAGQVFIGALFVNETKDAGPELVGCQIYGDNARGIVPAAIIWLSTQLPSLPGLYVSLYDTVGSVQWEQRNQKQRDPQAYLYFPLWPRDTPNRPDSKDESCVKVVLQSL